LKQTKTTNDYSARSCTRKLVDDLQTFIEEQSKQLIDKLNARLAKAKAKSGKNNGKLKRVGFGVYYVEEDLKTDE